MRSKKLLSLLLALTLMSNLISCIDINRTHGNGVSGLVTDTAGTESAESANDTESGETTGDITTGDVTTGDITTDDITTDDVTTDDVTTGDIPTDDVTTDDLTTDTTPPETQPEDTTPPSPPVYAATNESTKTIKSGITSKNAILIELGSYTVLAQKGADVRINPASMTKILTILVAVEHMESLDQSATVTRKTTDYCYIEEASVAGFKAHETVTVEDLLYGTILPSGADAALTLAECIAGSEEAFAELMNKKAAELGLVGSHFVTVTGLYHPDHYSTVHDIAVILKAALANDICKTVLSAKSYTTSKTNKSPNGIYLESIVHTRLSGTSVPGLTILGGKTGYLPEAGYCLATYATSDDGKVYILVTAGAPNNKKQPISDAAHVYKEYVE